MATAPRETERIRVTNSAQRSVTFTDDPNVNVLMERLDGKGYLPLPKLGHNRASTTFFEVVLFRAMS